MSTSDHTWLREALQAKGVDVGTLQVSDEIQTEEIRFRSETDSRCVDVLLSSRMIAADPTYRHVMENRIRHFIHLGGGYISDYARTEPCSLIFNMADGGGAGALSFDRPAGTDWPLFPDLYLLTAASERNGGEASHLAFADREPILFWRGTTTGGVYGSRDELFASHRVTSCLRLRDTMGERADCKISRVAQLAGYADRDAIEDLTQARVFGEQVSEARFADYQMYLDLPGNTAAWGTCFKYLAGCLVLRPPCARELCYSHLMLPWEHYIPVAPDMSDVAERVSWVLATPNDAAMIAERGQQLLRTFVETLPDFVKGVFDTNNEAVLVR